MTDDELRIKVAEALGWKSLPFEQVCTIHGHICILWQRGDEVVCEFDLEDYPNDLNAMHLTEKIIPAVKRWSYGKAIQAQIGENAGWPSVTFATARQRALAFVTTMG